MPKPIKFILDKFSQGRENRLAGYLSFKDWTKTAEIRARAKVQDLRNWLIIYGYWNAGEQIMLLPYSGRWQRILGAKVGEIPARNQHGITAPTAQLTSGYFESPQQYLEWYARRSQKPSTCQRLESCFIGSML